MPNKPISQFLDNPAPSLADYFPIDHNAVTYKITLDAVGNVLGIANKLDTNIFSAFTATTLTTPIFSAYTANTTAILNNKVDLDVYSAYTGNTLTILNTKLSGITHDNSLSGDGTIDNPLKAVGSGDINDVVVTVRVATTGNLAGAPVYNNGTAGSGATLTHGTNGVLPSLDGIGLIVGDRVLVKNQTTKLQNGVYEVTSIGSTITPWVLTRAIDSDETIELDDMTVTPSEGTNNKGLLYAQQTNNPIVGVNDLVFTQISGIFLHQLGSGTQVASQIPIYTNSARQVTKGFSGFTYSATTNKSDKFTINSVPYFFPSGNTSGYLTNNGSGLLSWSTGTTQNLEEVTTKGNTTTKNIYLVNSSGDTIIELGRFGSRGYLGINSGNNNDTYGIFRFDSNVPVVSSQDYYLPLDSGTLVLSVNGVKANNSGEIRYSDVFVSGGTYSAGTATFNNTTGGTFSVTGFSTGATSSRLFPNGYTFIAEDYEIKASDEGKIIYSTIGTPVNVTMPASVIFTGGMNIGLLLINGGTFQRTSNDAPIEVLPYIGGTVLDTINNKAGEFLLFQTVAIGDGGNSQLQPISTSVLEDNGVLKTMLKYLYDKSQNAIPLSGTTNPVSGYLQFNNETQLFTNNSDSTATHDISFKADSISINTSNGVSDTIYLTQKSGGGENKFTIQLSDVDYVTTLSLDNRYLIVDFDYETSRGISSSKDYTANITDFDFTQKKYVDEIAGKIFELGTITFEDVNGAAADNEIFFNLNTIPTGYYPEKIFQITEIFDADISNAGVQSNATGVNTNAYLDVNKKTITYITFADDFDIANFNDLQFRITFDTNNPQNLTTGSIIIKALILKYPI